ncbi:MAG: hypothetical protein MJ250_03155 [Alphaproteobacteria bacterium]|nr:hypothetical protein [Alphaproteobacteria bacterium]
MASVKKEVQPTMAKKSNRKKFMSTFSACLIMLPLFFMLRSTVFFLSMAMLPTLLSLIFENKAQGKYRHRWLCIGSMNFAGAFPFLLKMWRNENTLEGALSFFFNPSSMMIILGMVLIGFLFSRGVPTIVLSYLEQKDKYHVHSLREKQNRLIELWGPEVANLVNVTPEVSVQNQTAVKK